MCSAGRELHTQETRLVELSSTAGLNGCSACLQRGRAPWRWRRGFPASHVLYQSSQHPVLCLQQPKSTCQLSPKHCLFSPPAFGELDSDTAAAMPPPGPKFRSRVSFHLQTHDLNAYFTPYCFSNGETCFHLTKH